ncbi:hypothetical protein PoB_004767300 [Plakobranchus ocellatus]|uniref:Uncharacterized protein n=1 Tax=Plakobranchus ocellatus TaxID=259542 RepID=A0AAV4BPX8_9GAST|nr:hypothetical protein PoB_004767300 [Plakobranchus ocellatus]
MEIQPNNLATMTTALPNPPQRIIGVEMEVPLCDQSLKRQAEEVDEEGKKQRKAMKKRRSSLSTKRRSIIGDFPADPSSGSSSQESCASSGNRPTSSQDDCLKPNPVNLKMETVIKLMEAQIQKLNQEHDEWQDVLNSHVKRQEESKQLSSDLKLPASSVPDDVKAIGEKDYIRVKPLDLETVKTQVTDLLAQYQFDREACCQDLRLIKTTVETLHLNNKALASCLQQAVEEKRSREEENDMDNRTNQLHTKGAPDPKDAVSRFISNC